MDTQVYIASMVGLLAAVGGLSSLAVTGSDRFLEVGSWAAALGFLAALVVTGSLRRKSSPVHGVTPLAVGLLLLTLAASLPLFPERGVGLAAWLSGGRLSPQGLGLVLQGGGALGAALGLLFWGSELSERAANAGQTVKSLNATVARLEQQVRDQEELLQSALTVDEATGVLNRRPFLERVDDVIRRDARLGKPMAFVLVSLPSYHSVVTHTGAPAGDRVRREVANALRDATRGTDQIGRLGSDLFAAVLGECQDPRPVVDRMLIALQSGPTTGGRTEEIQVRIGAVLVRKPELAFAFTDIFRLADEAVRSLPSEGESCCAYRSLDSTVSQAAAQG